MRYDGNRPLGRLVLVQQLQCDAVQKSVWDACVGPEAAKEKEWKDEEGEKHANVACLFFEKIARCGSSIER